jgi:uncharacterized protein YndB with AHSA1/START domain
MMGIFVEKSIEIEAPPPKVWEIIVSPDRWAGWMLVVPEVGRAERLEQGSQVQWKDEHGKVYLTGAVLVLEPNRKLVLELQDVSWPRPAEPGEVAYAFSLVKSNGGTRLEYILGDLSIDPEAQQWRDAYQQGRELECIKALTETQVHPPA